MIGGALRRIADALRGEGGSAVTVPSLDGVLRPDRRLDEAPVRHDCPGVDALVSTPSGVLASSGRHLLRVTPAGVGGVEAEFDAEITALAALQDGVAVALEGGALRVLGGRHDGLAVPGLDGARCPTALVASGDRLYVCDGSTARRPADWPHDLMERGASGSVWSLDLGSGERRRIAGGLAFPNGVAVRGEGLVVSESWRHRLIGLGAGPRAPVSAVLADLPGYPGRLSPDGRGGHWLAVFAPRSQLVEFVLRETAFRRRMVREVAPDHWIAPTLRSGGSFYEPLQGGGVKHLGMLKPWAPSRSSGLLVRLDRDFQPVESLHSRADGRAHGVTAAVEHGGDLYVAIKGDGAIAVIPSAEAVAA